MTRITGSFSRSGQYLVGQLFVPVLAEIGREPEHVAPPGAVVRRMRIARLVAMGMMLAMVGDPSDGRAFAGKRADRARAAIGRADRSESCRASAGDGSTGRCRGRRKPTQHGGQAERFPGEEPDRAQRQKVDGCHPDHDGPIEAVLPGVRLRVVVRDWSGGRRNRDMGTRLRAGGWRRSEFSCRSAGKRSRRVGERGPARGAREPGRECLIVSMFRREPFVAWPFDSLSGGVCSGGGCRGSHGPVNGQPLRDASRLFASFPSSKFYQL